MGCPRWQCGGCKCLRFDGCGDGRVLCGDIGLRHFGGFDSGYERVEYVATLRRDLYVLKIGAKAAAFAENIVTELGHGDFLYLR
jgi:hypothetical protein